MKFDSLKISRDINGNKVLRIKPRGASRGFSIQTNGNLPMTERQGICGYTIDEIVAHINACGTKAQRQAITQ